MEFVVFTALALAAAAAFAAWKIRTGGLPAEGLLSRVAESVADPESELQTRFVESPRRREYRLLNSSEQQLYARLLEAMPNMLVFAQVGVAQLALLRGRQEAEQLRSMAGRGVDFLVCRRDFAIVAAIELCWPQPQSVAGHQLGSEEYKRQALERLGIPLIVFRPNKLPDADTISREIATAVLQRNRLEAEREREQRP